MFWAPRAGGRFGGAIASRMVPQHACAVAGCALVGSRSPRAFAQRAWLRDETVSSCCCYSDSNWLADLACLGSCAENQQVVSPIIWVAWVIRTVSGKSHQNMTHRVTVESSDQRRIRLKRSATSRPNASPMSAAPMILRNKYARSYRGTCIPRDQRYDLFRNGILLHGPRGAGKTFLARATAGEFRLNIECISTPKLLTRWTGATGENIQSVFAQAAARRPVLFSIDEPKWTR